MTDPLAFGIALADVRDRLKLMNYFVTLEDIRAATEILDREEGFGFRAPAAFTSIASEAADRDRKMSGATGHIQRVNVSLSVLFAESVARSGRDADDRVDLTRKAIIRQLIYWTPSGASSALQYDRYLLRATGLGNVWGEVLFRTSYRLSDLA